MITSHQKKMFSLRSVSGRYNILRTVLTTSHIFEFRSASLSNNTICLYIAGGKADIPSGLPKDYYRGFRGCVGYVFIQDKELHLYNDRHEINSSIDFCH